ncbi:MAG: zinc-ribbon domain containing protein [Elusimicrobiota bacterium]
MGFIDTLKSIFGFSSEGTKMAAGDRKLICLDCNKDFIFDAGEQKFFKEKGFTDPKRCPKCRKKIKFKIKKRPKNKQNFKNRFKKNSVIDGNSPYADER